MKRGLWAALVFAAACSLPGGADATLSAAAPAVAASSAAARSFVIPEFDPHDAFIHGPDSVRGVALSFDDGPDRDTPAILKVLAKHHARATFFMIGRNVVDRPGLAKAVADAGNEIGNHTYDHLNMCQQTTATMAARKAQLASEFSQADSAISGATGVTPTLVRIPYACRSAWIENTARRLGYTVVRWSVDGEDWKRPGAAAIASYYLDHAMPGAVFLFHDGGGNRTQTAQALDAILSGLERRGLRPLTVGQMLRLTLPGPPDAGR